MKLGRHDQNLKALGPDNQVAAIRYCRGIEKHCRTWRCCTTAESRSDPRIANGRAIYAQRCAACHGAKLQGQPEWKRRLPSGRLLAPPHDETGHTWHHGDRILFDVVKRGTAAVIGDPTYQTDMPIFGEVLTDDDIRAALTFIKSTWPERERAYQAEMTKHEGGWD